jgi:hypothetical protein
MIKARRAHGGVAPCSQDWVANFAGQALLLAGRQEWDCRTEGEAAARRKSLRRKKERNGEETVT